VDEQQRVITKFGIDMRLTGADLANLSPEQIAAVYEGIGKVASLQHADRRPTDTGSYPSAGEGR
jgi:hypothetical protein